MVWEESEWGGIRGKMSGEGEGRDWVSGEDDGERVNVWGG